MRKRMIIMPYYPSYVMAFELIISHVPFGIYLLQNRVSGTSLPKVCGGQSKYFKFLCPYLLMFCKCCHYSFTDMLLCCLLAFNKQNDHYAITPNLDSVYMLHSSKSKFKLCPFWGSYIKIHIILFLSILLLLVIMPHYFWAFHIVIYCQYMWWDQQMEAAGPNLYLYHLVP